MFLAFGAHVSPVIIGEVFIMASLISASLSAAATVIERLISFWLATVIGMLILPHYGSSVLDKISLSSKSDDESDDELLE